MLLVTLRQVLDEAAKGGYGVGAFNVNNLEQLQGVLKAARESKPPVPPCGKRPPRTCGPSVKRTTWTSRSPLPWRKWRPGIADRVRLPCEAVNQQGRPSSEAL